MRLFSASLLALVLVIGLCACTYAADVSSPNKRITVSVATKDQLEPYPAGKRLYYNIAFDGKPLLLDSPFRLDFKNMPSIARELEITGEKRRGIDDTWESRLGTRRQIRNNAQ